MIRLVIVGLSLLYLFGVKSISAMEIAGLKLEIGPVALMPWMFALTLGIFEVLLLIDFLSRRVERAEAYNADEAAAQAEEDAAKQAWLLATKAQKSGVKTASHRSGLEKMAFVLTYLLPAALGIYCIVDFSILYAGR